MIQRGKQTTFKANINAASLEEEMGKDMEHVWSLPLTIDFLFHINNVGNVPLGAVEHFSINEKGGRYTKRRVNHN